MSDRPASSTQQLDDKPNTFLFLSATVLIITVVVCFVLSYLPVCVILSNCGSCCDCKTVNKSSDTVYHTRGVKKPRDCQDIQSAGQNSSGVYHVTPRGTHNGFDVYCDMETEDGGWLVFQRRAGGAVDFYKGWDEYQAGFGNVEREHWLGNFPLKVILSQGFYELRIDLEDWEGEKRFAKYKIFDIGDVTESYKLTVAGYSGDAGDSLTYHSGAPFATKDRDVTEHKCATTFPGSWWFRECLYSDLNGQYPASSFPAQKYHNIIWYHWKGDDYSLKLSEMKIRRDSLGLHSGRPFSTKDKDFRKAKCATQYQGAWWYVECHESNLNGLYLEGVHPSIYAKSIIWYKWKGHYYSLKRTEMKIRKI